MSLTITNQPQNYRTAYNPIEFVLYETSAIVRAYARFKYIVDIYLASAPAVKLGSLRVPANPDGYGRSDAHGIIESYIQTNLGVINNFSFR